MQHLSLQSILTAGEGSEVTQDVPMAPNPGPELGHEENPATTGEGFSADRLSQTPSAGTGLHSAQPARVEGVHSRPEAPHPVTVYNGPIAFQRPVWSGSLAHTQGSKLMVEMTGSTPDEGAMATTYCFTIHMTIHSSPGSGGYQRPVWDAPFNQAPAAPRQVDQLTRLPPVQTFDFAAAGITMAQAQPYFANAFTGPLEPVNASPPPPAPPAGPMETAGKRLTSLFPSLPPLL
jgi:hypothetical protein